MGVFHIIHILLNILVQDRRENVPLLEDVMFLVFVVAGDRWGCSDGQASRLGSEGEVGRKLSGLKQGEPRVCSVPVIPEEHAQQGCLQGGEY